MALYFRKVICKTVDWRPSLKTKVTDGGFLNEKCASDSRLVMTELDMW